MERMQTALTRCPRNWFRNVPACAALPFHLKLFHKTMIPSLFLFLFYLFGGTIRGEGWEGGQVGGEGKGKIKKSEKRGNNYFSMKFCTHKKTELQLKTFASVHRREDVLK